MPNEDDRRYEYYKDLCAIKQSRSINKDAKIIMKPQIYI